MYAIIYTALAINATGLGDKKFYNADGALDPVAVTNTFEAARTGGLIGGDAAYTATLVIATNAQSLYANSIQFVDSFTRPNQVLEVYRHASLFDGATIVDGEITVPGGGATVTVAAVSVVSRTDMEAVSVHADVTLTGSPQVVTAGITQPEFPVTLNVNPDQDLGGALITIVGSYLGAPVTESIDPTTVSYSKYVYDTITSITYPGSVGVTGTVVSVAYSRGVPLGVLLNPAVHFIVGVSKVQAFNQYTPGYEMANPIVAQFGMDASHPAGNWLRTSETDGTTLVVQYATY